MATAPLVPTLTDGAVRLDAYTLADVGAQVAGEDEEHARRFGWHPHRSTPETVRAWIVRRQEDWRTGGPTRAWAVRKAATGALVGGCEVRLRDSGVAQMSWWVFPDYRRHGLASRAVRLACAFTCESLGVRRREANIAPDNTASRRVAARAGFAHEGTYPDEGGRIMVRYARTA